MPNIFKPVIEKILNKLAGCKVPLLSQAGRSVLQYILIYTLSCYKAPVMITYELDKICRNFWWNHKNDKRKLHLINWNVLCQPVELRGLGFRKSEDMNDALLPKQAWKILEEPNSFLASFMLSKCGRENHFLNIQERQNSYQAWKSILTLREIISKGLDIQIWSGNKINFTNTTIRNMTMNQLIALTSRWWDEQVLSEVCPDVMQKNL